MIRNRPLTLALIASWALAYAADLGAPDFDALTGRGPLPPMLSALALVPEQVAAGEWWRVVTSGFVHFGVIHLALNAWGMYIAGGYLEPRIERPRLALVHLVGLATGGLAAYLTTAGQVTVTAGASGAILGLFGAMAVITFPLARHDNALISATLPIVGTIMYGFTHPNISNAGHIGGLIGGAVVGAMIAARSPSTWIEDERAHQEAAAREAMRASGDRPAAVKLSVDEIRRDTVVLRHGRAFRWSIPVIALLLAGVSGVAFASPEALTTGRVEFDVPALLVGWFALAMAVLVMLGRSTRVELSPTGLSFESPWTDRHVPWCDIEEFSERTIWTGYGGQTILGYTLVPQRAYARRGWFGSFPDARLQGIPRLFGPGLEAVRGQILSFHERWRNVAVASPPAARPTRTNRVPVALLLATGLPAVAAGVVTYTADSRIRSAPRDLLIAPREIGAYAVDRDEALGRPNAWARDYVSATGVRRFTVWVSVFGTADDARKSLARSTCDRYYRWPEQPSAVALPAPPAGDETKACLYTHQSGQRDIAVWTSTRNVRVDVSGWVEHPTSEYEGITAVRRVVDLHIARIERAAAGR